MTLAGIGATPGIVISRRLAASVRKLRKVILSKFFNHAIIVLLITYFGFSYSEFCGGF